jgi:hypothetical protein
LSFLAMMPSRLETMCRVTLDLLAFTSPPDIFPPLRADLGRARVHFAATSVSAFLHSTVALDRTNSF